MTAGKTETAPSMTEGIWKELYHDLKKGYTKAVYDGIRGEKPLYRPIKGNALLGMDADGLRDIFARALAEELGITGETDGVRRLAWDLALRAMDSADWEEIRSKLAEE